MHPSTTSSRNTPSYMNRRYVNKIDSDNTSKPYNWDEITALAVPIYNAHERVIGQACCAELVQQHLLKNYGYEKAPYGAFITAKVKEARSRAVRQTH